MSHVDPICQHGMLRQGCDLCDMIVQNAALRARVEALESAARNVIRCNDRVCMHPAPIRCPAQCQADQALRAVLRLAGNRAGSRHEPS